MYEPKVSVPIPVTIITGTSSVEIQSRARGAPQITVHCYWAGSEEATQAAIDTVSRIAIETFEKLNARYGRWADGDRD